MCFLKDAHSIFVKKAILSAQITDNVLTVIPTFFFLSTCFVLFYEHLHRTTSRSTRFKTKIIRDLKFHWIYFNATRLWFIFLSCVKRFLYFAEDFIEANIPERDRSFNTFLTNSSAVVIVTSVAILPSILLYLNYLSHNDMPNFLMWVMEDPYLRHEIGISGHCLERPLIVDEQKMKNYPYRSKRSTSFDHRPWIRPKSLLHCRSCKSMIEHNVVKSVEDLLK